MKKVVVLIDGQNLYYSLRGMHIKEKAINWTKFFNGLLDRDEELIRAYWFRPQKILDTYFTNSNIKYQIVKKHFKNYTYCFPDNLDKIPENISAQITEKVKEVEDWLQYQKN